MVLRAVGVAPTDAEDVAQSDEELRLVLARSRRRGFLTGDEQRLMENVLVLTEKTARQAMNPRSAIVYLSTTNPLRENLWIARQSGHTRFPLCDGDLDHVIGMVNIKDLFEARESGQLAADFREVRRDVLFLPDSIALDRVLREFQQRHIHMAILVDEYGVTSGMITLEDVLEELVGEIQDEFDRETPPIAMIRPGLYRIDGLCPLDVFQRTFGMEQLDSRTATVGGFVFDLCGHLPERGETVSMGEDRFVVESVKNQRIVSVRFMTQRQVNLGAASKSDASDLSDLAE
ncbi:HlyC/CorC family transporter [Candidatus Sumerlaeota bacterium]|nr:HlyC/CorC family transporter [Candidatus Sumerlaeota bacterium]